MLKVASKTVPYGRLTDKEKIQLKSEIRHYNYENEKVVFDFSFEGAFVSCKLKNFDNYLHNK